MLDDVKVVQEEQSTVLQVQEIVDQAGADELGRGKLPGKQNTGDLGPQDLGEFIKGLDWGPMARP